MKIKKIYISLIGLSLTFNMVLGQSDCVVALREAQKLFENGLIEEVPSKLNPCIRRGFNKNEKIQAYKLLILCDLCDDQHEKADSLMLKLLKIEPEFQISPQLDPSEFIELYNSYRTLPTYTIGINAGLNFSDIELVNSYGVHNEIASPGKYRPSSAGYHIGVDISRNLSSRIEAKMGFNLVTNKYLNTNKMFDGEFSETTFEETQTRLDIPLSLNVDILKKNIKPFLSIGICGGYIADAKAEVIRTIIDSQNSEEGTIDLSDFRKPINLWFIYAAGVKYKVKSGHITFNLNYHKSPLYQMKTGQRYVNPEFLYRYYHIDDDYKLNFWGFSFGYTYSFYKPKKRK